MKANNRIIVAFHIGRGGKHFNPGHVTFIGEMDFQKLMRAGNNADRLFEQDRDENGRFCKHYMTDCNGTVMVDADEMTAKTGRLDWDGDYDTDICRYIEDCSNEDIFRIILSNEVLSYDLEKWLREYIQVGIEHQDSEIECFVEDHRSRLEEITWLGLNTEEEER